MEPQTLVGMEIEVTQKRMMRLEDERNAPLDRSHLFSTDEEVTSRTDALDQRKVTRSRRGY